MGTLTQKLIFPIIAFILLVELESVLGSRESAGKNVMRNEMDELFQETMVNDKIP